MLDEIDVDDSGSCGGFELFATPIGKPFGETCKRRREEEREDVSRRDEEE